MTASEDILLRTCGRNRIVRRALQRWALRYAGRLLARLGGVHATSADLLLGIGSAKGGRETMHGISPTQRRPAGTYAHTIRRSERSTAVLVTEKRDA